ncbi:MAG: flavin-dependent dehydrogenase [Saprospiraceae bacterium]|jgi:flavin-dependent dehydrogenase
MKKYDVIILGGGLAGLTLALQLKLSMAEISILVLEKRSDHAPVATHKVGESIAELGSHYLREVLQLKEYLNECQLPKFGFRFFFGQEHKEDIARRIEVGSKVLHPMPAHQIDRGLFENELVNRLHNHGVDVVLGATVKNVELSKAGHEIHFKKEGEDYYNIGRWIIDSTGRRGLLKRKLGLAKELDHDINAAWFRLSCDIDIDDWSEDKAWSSYTDPGRRRLATNHLMGEGYWVWLIPLISGNTSIGIVADPTFHPFDQFNTFEKAMKWLEKKEPLAAKMLGKHKDKLSDFKVMKHLSHDSKQFFSSDRWGLTGDSGAFMDPFYSPGTDFVALNNSWLTELITSDISGENIGLRTMIYEHTQRELLSGWILLYKNMYGLFGKTQIMLMKIVWDWGSYWAIPTLMFSNDGYTNIAVLKQYAAGSDSIGRRFSKLNEQIQALFIAWGQHDIESYSDQQINIFDLDCLDQFHQGLKKKYTPVDLIPRIESNLKILEQISAEIFRLVSAKINGTPPDMKVDPYRMDIEDNKNEILEKSKGQHALGVDESIKADLARVWLSPKKTISNEYA